MLEASTRIYLRDPEQEDNLVPAVVSETLGEKVMVRFLQPVTFEPGIETVVLYHNENNGFVSQPCQLQRMFSRGQYPTGALVLDGEGDIAENRNSLRIDIRDQRISAVVNGGDSGEVINISFGGIALMLEDGGYAKEQWLDVTLHDDCNEHEGKMQVRSQSKSKDGRFRYGLMADPTDADLISQLTRITHEQQNDKTSRLDTNKQAGTQANPADTSDKPAAESGQSNIEGGAQGKPAARDGTKRMHQRTPWPGMAKVYIREDDNMRVLSVDTEDLSRGGISFISQSDIDKGSEVLFEKPVTGGFFRVMIAVRNVRVLRGGEHRVGAQFLGVPLKPGEMPKAFGGQDEAA